MMTIRKLRPRCVRGAATGDFLVWLVAAATIAGFVYVLAREPAMQPAGDEEAVAARLAPVGRVTLSAPAAMPETGTAKTSASGAAGYGG
jgi:hypothetical protein